MKAPVHVASHAANCTICKDEGLVRVVAEAYVNRRTLKEVAGEAGVDVQVVQRHIKAFPELRQRRENNIEGIAQLIVEKGLEAIHAGEMAISPTLFADAVKTLAKIKGLFIDRTMDLTRTLERLTDEELRHFEETGRLPDDETMH